MSETKTDWMIRTRRFLLQEQIEDDDRDLNVSIITVPKNLMSTSNSQLYTPQLVSMGPYHCQHPELQGFERYKLSAAKRIKKRLHGSVKFDDLVRDFIQSEHIVRAHYHRYLDFSSDTLAWMMIIDASFMVDFLAGIHSADGRRSATPKAVILGDFIMVENQIPLFLLFKIIRTQYESKEEGDQQLSRIVIGFLEDICPFKMRFRDCVNDISRHSHVLDLLYRLVVVVVPDDPDTRIHMDEAGGDDDKDVEIGRRSRRGRATVVLDFFVNSLWCCIKHAVHFMITVCLKTASSLPIFLMLKHLCSFGRSSNEEETAVGVDDQEIPIPSVSELMNAGVKFMPITCNVDSPTISATISFDTNKGMFQLPTISLDSYTEGVLRNLVAYEVSIVGPPWKLTRYMELMSGMIHTKDDVRLLREKGVVVNCMRSDKDAADMWNGMRSSTAAGCIDPKFDRIVRDVNCYANRKWRFRISSWMRKNGLDSWHLPRFIFAFFFFLFLGLHFLSSLFR